MSLCRQISTNTYLRAQTSTNANGRNITHLHNSVLGIDGSGEVSVDSPHTHHTHSIAQIQVTKGGLFIAFEHKCLQQNFQIVKLLIFILLLFFKSGLINRFTKC